LETRQKVTKSQVCPTFDTEIYKLEFFNIFFRNQRLKLP